MCDPNCMTCICTKYRKIPSDNQESYSTFKDISFSISDLRFVYISALVFPFQIIIFHIGIYIFNAADTYCVSQLGMLAVASFTIFTRVACNQNENELVTIVNS